ncbi:hypothetical protein MRX96_043928 [Rhipicephalus microplus]
MPGISELSPAQAFNENLNEAFCFSVHVKFLPYINRNPSCTTVPAWPRCVALRSLLRKSREEFGREIRAKEGKRAQELSLRTAEWKRPRGFGKRRDAWGERFGEARRRVPRTGRASRAHRGSARFTRGASRRRLVAVRVSDPAKGISRILHGHATVRDEVPTDAYLLALGDHNRPRIGDLGLLQVAFAYVWNIGRA